MAGDHRSGSRTADRSGPRPGIDPRAELTGARASLAAHSFSQAPTAPTDPPPEGRCGATDGDSWSPLTRSAVRPPLTGLWLARWSPQP